MQRLAGARIVLGVTGSIAAFKAAGLASDLVKAGAHVRVVLTSEAERFVGRQTFAGITGYPAATSLWSAAADIDHLEMAAWCEAFTIAPASANTIARLALGLADDLLSTMALATRAAILIAPAMESQMYRHPATQQHLATLGGRGVRVVGPAEGRLSSGAVGVGRMVEPADVMAAIDEMLISRKSMAPADADGAGPGRRDLGGLAILVTAGPTREPIDPVRFISNRSSGKMGFALAQRAWARGAHVTLVSGPVDQPLLDSLPSEISLRSVETAAEMRDAVMAAAPHADVLIMAAAVADFRPSQRLTQKLKKAPGISSLDLTPTDDILTLLATESPSLLRVGFAAETDALAANARHKLTDKNLALLVANDVRVNRAVFGSDENQVSIFRPDAPPIDLPRLPKVQVADRILDEIAALLHGDEVRFHHS